jgi:hypothetical protein
MINATLDMNSIIDLEKKKGDWMHIEHLIKMYEKGQIRLRVVAISASEQKPDRTYPSNFSEFKDRIAAIGLEMAEILKPLGYVGITYNDWCVVADKKTGPMVNLERKIHRILFPETQFSYREFCKKNHIDINSHPMDHNWRNHKCDVLALWSHIYYGGGIFVTRDADFHRKKCALIALGAGQILEPKDTIMELKGVLWFLWIEFREFLSSLLKSRKQ